MIRLYVTQAELHAKETYPLRVGQLDVCLDIVASIPHFLNLGWGQVLYYLVEVIMERIKRLLKRAQVMVVWHGEFHKPFFLALRTASLTAEKASSSV
jgi:hypothetical protein